MWNMTDEITLDAIEKLLWESTKFQIDQAQVDAFKVLVEARVSQQAALLAAATPELVQAQLATLTALARQLLDTGGRMRLDPAGQLDVTENPVATRADIEALGRKLISLRDAVAAVTGAVSELAQREEHAALRELQGLSIDAAETFYEDDEPVEKVFAAFDAGEKFVTAPPDLLAEEEEKPAAETFYMDLLEGKLPKWEEDLLEGKLPKWEGRRGIDALRDDPGFADVVAANERDLEQREAGIEQAKNALAGGDQVVAEFLLDDGTREHVAQIMRPRRKRAPQELNPDGTLTCTQCGAAKSTVEYFRNKKSPTGFETRCRACRGASKAA